MYVSVKELIPVRSDTFFGNIHTTLVDMTYHKLSKLASKVHLYRKYVQITKTMDFGEMQQKLLNLKKEIPPRISMYDADIYITEIFSITFGTIDEDERVKNTVEEITKHANIDDLTDLNIKKWEIVKKRLDTFISEATNFLLEGDYTEQQAYYIITYIQGLTILNKIVDKCQHTLLKKKWRQYSDFSEALKLSVKFLFLSLITAKYIDGEINPEDYMYDMEYISEIFVKEEEESNQIEDISSLIALTT